MERTTEVLILEGEVTKNQIERIPKDFQGDIVINGNITCLEKECEIPCSIWLNGNIKTNYLKINGDMFCGKSSHIISEEKIEVAGDAILKEACLIDSTDIDIGGDFEGKGKISSNNINVLGQFMFKGEIDLHDSEIYVGEHIAIDGIVTRCKAIKSGCKSLTRKEALL